MSAWSDGGGRDVPSGYGARDVLRPRWDDSRPLAERITKRGRFAHIDPTQPGEVWKPRRWIALFAWAVLVGGAYARAWSEHRDELSLGPDDRPGS